MDDLGEAIFANEHSRMKRKALVIGLVVFGLVMGFVQEKTKVSLNFIIDAAAQSTSWDDLDVQNRVQVLNEFRRFRPSEYYSNHEPIEFYLNYSKKQLATMKWLLLGIWVLVFWVINYFLLRVAFGRTMVLSYLHWGQGLLLLIGGATFGLAKATGTMSQGYGVARELIGGVQSMIPAFILGVGYLLFQRIEDDKKNFRSE